MKGIKSILGVLAVASLLFSFNANAQEYNNRDENGKVVRGAYETNRFGDNWFIGIGAGVNSFFDNGTFGSFGLATDVNLGKWFTPSVGARLGWHGLWDKINGNIAANYQPGADKFGYNNVHADMLWNISNAFGGYKETRTWEFIPYATFNTGWFTYGGSNNWEYGAGLGLLQDIRLGGHVDLFLDFAWNLIREASLSKSPQNIIASIPSLTAGFIFNLGKSNFDRHSSITPVVIPVPFTTEQYNALQDKVAALEKENAELKDKIAALEAANANKNYKEGQTYIYQNGEFVETENTISTPATVYFDCGSAKLSERELAHLEFYAQNALNGDSEVVVTGSADSATGSARRNQQLSEQRADYVKNLLVNKYGLNADNIETVAEGDTNNVFDTPAKNRVVTIRLK